MYKNLTNYHSHCDFCDGRAPMEDFVKSAIEHGFSSYGVSSHSPLPDYVELYSVLQLDKVSEYIDEINRLKLKYTNEIELLAGMEVDYIDSEINPANEYFRGLPLDYRIGSVHFLKVGDGQVVDIDVKPKAFLDNLEKFYNNDVKRIVTDYFDAKMRMVELGGFDFVAHTDKISMNITLYQSDMTQQGWYKRKIGEYFDFIAEKGMMLEVNTKVLHTRGVLFPNEEHLATLHKLGIPLVVNSDAHSPHLVNSGRMEVIEKLRNVGYKTIREIHQGGWQDVEIRKM